MSSSRLLHLLCCCHRGGTAQKPRFQHEWVQADATQPTVFSLQEVQAVLIFYTTTPGWAVAVIVPNFAKRNFECVFEYINYGLQHASEAIKKHKVTNLFPGSSSPPHKHNEDCRHLRIGGVLLVQRRSWWFVSAPWWERNAGIHLDGCFLS